MDELSKPDRYLVVEAFRVSKGKYSLYDKFGAEIKVETPVIKELLQLQPEARYQVTSDGDLVIENPVCFADRGAIRPFSNVFHVTAREEGCGRADGRQDKLGAFRHG